MSAGHAGTSTLTPDFWIFVQAGNDDIRAERGQPGYRVALITKKCHDEKL